MKLLERNEEERTVVELTAARLNENDDLADEECELRTVVDVTSGGTRPPLLDLDVPGEPITGAVRKFGGKIETSLPMLLGSLGSSVGLDLGLPTEAAEAELDADAGIFFGAKIDPENEPDTFFEGNGVAAVALVLNLTCPLLLCLLASELGEVSGGWFC